MAGASTLGEEFEASSQPSKQTLKVQDELAQAERPLFTTPEGEAFEVPGIVEGEAGSATSLAKKSKEPTNSGPVQIEKVDGTPFARFKT